MDIQVPHVSEGVTAVTIFAAFMGLFGWVVKLILGKYFESVDTRIAGLRQDLIDNKKEAENRLAILTKQHEQNENRINKLMGEDRKELLEAINRSTESANRSTDATDRSNDLVKQCMETMDDGRKVAAEQSKYLKILYERLVTLTKK